MRYLRIAALVLAIGLSAATALAADACAANDLLCQSNIALQNGEADKAIGLLSAALRNGTSPADTHNLLCRVRFTLGQWDTAINECEQAIHLNDQSSANHMWLGRTLGEKADHTSFMSAYSIAKRVRTEFERAVQLDPRNSEAMADLGEFYVNAPGVVGGGIDKAERLAPQLVKVDPLRGHELLARIHEARKDYTGAEQEFKAALYNSKRSAFQWMTLASYYRRHQRWQEMESAIRSGISAADKDKHSGVALYNGASVLITADRLPDVAARMLETYLANPNKTEEAPTFVAYARLARVKDKLGDSAAAQRSRAAAVALAHDYNPAQETKH